MGETNGILRDKTRLMGGKDAWKGQGNGLISVEKKG